MAQEYLSAGLAGPSESFVDGLSVAGAVVIDCVVAAMTVVVGLAVVGVEVDTVVDAALVVVDTGTVVEAAGEVVVDVTLCSSSNSSVGSSRACISGEFEAPHADPISNTQSRAAAERIL